MLFLERLAEEQIIQALQRGEFDDLPGKGEPIPEELGMDSVPEDMRTAFRLLKNAGYVPEVVLILREMDVLIRLLDAEDEDSAKRSGQAMRLLVSRLGDLRGGNLALQDAYYQRIMDKLR